MNKPLYEIFSGEELHIAALIQRRRLQMLVHSYIYYGLDTNIITDDLWQKWAYELEDLQNRYPEIEKVVPYREGFENWDGSTGAFLPYNTAHVKQVAEHLLGKRVTKNTKILMPEKPKIVSSNSARKKLF